MPYWRCSWYRAGTAGSRSRTAPSPPPGQHVIEARRRYDRIAGAAAGRRPATDSSQKARCGLWIDRTPVSGPGRTQRRVFVRRDSCGATPCRCYSGAGVSTMVIDERSHVGRVSGVCQVLDAPLAKLFPLSPRKKQTRQNGCTADTVRPDGLSCLGERFELKQCRRASVTRRGQKGVRLRAD